MSLTIKPYSLEFCGMWHHLVETKFLQDVFFNCRQKSQLSYDHNAPNCKWQSFHRHFRRSKVKSYQRAHQSVNFSLSSITLRSEHQIRQFYSKNSFEKLPSTAYCSSTHYTYLWCCERSAIFSCCIGWTLYGCRCRSKCKICHNVS